MNLCACSYTLACVFTAKLVAWVWFEFFYGFGYIQVFLVLINYKKCLNIKEL